VPQTGLGCLFDGLGLFWLPLRVGPAGGTQSCSGDVIVPNRRPWRGPRAACRGRVNVLVACGAGEFGSLRRHAVAVRGEPCIIVFRGWIMHLIYGPERPHDFKTRGLVRNSRIMVTAQVPRWRAQVGPANEICGHAEGRLSCIFGTHTSTDLIRLAYLGSYEL